MHVKPWWRWQGRLLVYCTLILLKLRNHLTIRYPIPLQPFNTWIPHNQNYSALTLGSGSKVTCANTSSVSGSAYNQQLQQQLSPHTQIPRKKLLMITLPSTGRWSRYTRSWMEDHKLASAGRPPDLWTLLPNPLITRQLSHKQHQLWRVWLWGGGEGKGRGKGKGGKKNFLNHISDFSRISNQIISQN